MQVHGRLIREMEKKLSKRHVIFTAERTILGKTFRRKGLALRPRSRTCQRMKLSWRQKSSGKATWLLECRVVSTETLGASQTRQLQRNILRVIESKHVLEIALLRDAEE